METLLDTTYKVGLQMDQPNAKGKTIKLIKENVGKYLCDLKVGRTTDMGGCLKK